MLYVTVIEMTGWLVFVCYLLFIWKCEGVVQ